MGEGSTREWVPKSQGRIYTGGGGSCPHPSTVTVIAMNRVGSTTEKGGVRPYRSRPTSPGHESLL